MPHRYTLAERKAAVQFVDDHKDVPINVAAKRLSIPVNTLYSWTAEKGRKELLLADTADILEAEVKRDERPLQRYAVSPPPVATNAEARIAALERENLLLRKLVAAYRDAVELP